MPISSCQSKKKKAKSSLHTFCTNPTHSKLKEYVNLLLEKGMIEERELKGKKMFFMKEQGHKFLLEFERIREFSDSFGL